MTIQYSDFVPTGKPDAISVQVLLGKLNLDTSVAQFDLEDVLRQGLSMSRKNQDRCTCIIQERRLIAWLRLPKDGLLLLDGNARDVYMGISSTTLVAAQLIEIIEVNANHKSVFCMYWFFGQHRRAEQDVDTEVARSVCHLIGQLIQQCQDLHRCYFKRSDYEAVKTGDIDGLCDVVENLIDHLPRGSIVFCILDWISSIEDYYRRDDAKLLVRRLYEMATESPRLGVIFKVLLTHPGGGFLSSREIPKEDMLIMPEYTVGSGIGYGPRLFKHSMEKVIDDVVEDASGVDSESEEFDDG